MGKCLSKEAKPKKEEDKELDTKSNSKPEVEQEVKKETPPPKVEEKDETSSSDESTESSSEESKDKPEKKEQEVEDPPKIHDDEDAEEHQLLKKYKLKKVVVIHRHGSRGPSQGALEPFSTPLNTSAKNSPITEWNPDEVEVLTPVGYDQMQKLGEWFSQVYFGHLHTDFLQTGKPSSFKWRSSKVERASSSGKYFWKGFGEKYGTPPENPVPYQDEDPDTYFRAWNADPAYREKVKEIKKSDDFNQKGEEEIKFLDDLHTRFGTDIEKKNAADKLSEMTYFKEIIECERYFDGKTAMVSKITEEEEEKIEELARWVWGRRFFIPGFGEIIGGKLLTEIIEELGNNESQFAVYSAHDYSILSLCAALGSDDYPEHVLGFGAFLLFEVHEHMTTGASHVHVKLNSRSFEDEHGKPIRSMQYNPKPFIVKDIPDGHVSLAALQQRSKY